MRRHPTLVLLALALVVPRASTRAQIVNEDPLLPVGTWRLGRVTATAPLTIDLTEAHGVEAGDELTVLEQGTPLGTLTLTEAVPGGFRGRMTAGDPRPEVGDQVAFRMGDADAEPEPPVGTIERALPQTAYYVLAFPPGALVAEGDRVPVPDEDGRETTLDVKQIAGDKAKVFCVRGLAVGTEVTLPARTRVIATETTSGDPLIGKVAYVRFRHVPEGTESEYAIGTILAVDRGKADGPVPSFVGRFGTTSGTAVWAVWPEDVQHVLILEHVPGADRDMAQALWEKERDERDAPHRAWERRAQMLYKFCKKWGTDLPTRDDLARAEREEREAAARRAARKAAQGDVLDGVIGILGGGRR